MSAAAAPATVWSRVFLVAVGVLTLLSLLPIWGLRLLPLQDYPQHLFISKVTVAYNDPSLDWQRIYLLDLSLKPYKLWYLLMQPLGKAFGVEAAGKAILTGYVLLVSALVLACRRITPPGSMPWAALLLFPLAFNQDYLMGFVNFVVFLPVLSLALLDLKAIAESSISKGRMVLHGAYLLLLFFAHPLLALVYLGLAGSAALCFLPDWRKVLRVLIPAFGLGAIFTAWYFMSYVPIVSHGRAAFQGRWWPFGTTLRYYLLMFTGMRITNGPDWTAVSLWLCSAAAIAGGWVLTGRRREGTRWILAMLAVSLAAYLVLPFWYGHYAYFNVRLAPLSYFALALLLCRLALNDRAGIVVAAAALMLVGISCRTQAMASAEAGEVIPIVSRIPKNSLVGGIRFDASSRSLDPEFFPELHAHEVDYYHVLVGGGANTRLLPNTMTPIHLRPGLTLPPDSQLASQMPWETWGPAYDYLVIRSAPPQFVLDLQRYRNFDFVSTSGHYTLMKNRTPR